MFKICQLVGCLAQLLVLTNDTAFSQEIDLELRDRFLKAVPTTERILEQVSFRARGTITNEKSSNSVSNAKAPALVAKLRQQGKDTAKPIVHKFEYAVHGKSVLETGSSNTGAQYIMARNGDYAFRISSAPQLKNYALEWLEQHGASPDADQLVERGVNRVKAAALESWMMFGLSVAQWTRSQDFTITGVRNVESAGDTFVRIDFEHIVDEVRPGHLCLSDAYMLCDPNSHWTLREYAATFNNAARKPVTRTRVVLSGYETVHEFPIATTSTATLTWIGDAKRVDTGVRTLELITKDVPEEEFFLSHYGLPEPNFVRPWFGIWSWYLIAGVVCLVVSRVILKRRTAKA